VRLTERGVVRNHRLSTAHARLVRPARVGRGRVLVPDARRTTVDTPTWPDREAWARDHAAGYLQHGLLPRPTVVLFEGDDATVYVRGGQRFGAEADPTQHESWSLLFGLGYVLRPEGAMVATPIRLRSDGDGALMGEAEGEAALGIEWMRRRSGGAVEHGGVVHTHGIDDRGGHVWRERIEASSGVGFRPLLSTAVEGGARADGAVPAVDMGAAESLYAITRFGFTVGVAHGWRERYGFDRPIDPRKVRREDRRRARQRWSRRREEVAR
jgi:hypothetical protein